MKKLKSTFCLESFLDALDFLTFMVQAPDIAQTTSIQKTAVNGTNPSAAPEPARQQLRDKSRK